LLCYQPPPTSVSVVFNFTVAQVVAMGRFAWHPWRTHLTTIEQESIRAALALVDLSARAETPVTNLSSGERQRALLARSLVQDAALMLLDEPISFLDPRHAHGFLTHLAQRCRQGTTGAVISLHDLRLARRYATTVVLLSGGQVVRQGVPEEILTAEVLEPVYGVTYDRLLS
jgi:ABC-type cobalamin/Fe3+-siderophores transport system ATPase subunit